MMKQEAGPGGKTEGPKRPLAKEVKEISVNKRRIRVETGSLTGEQILGLAGLRSAEYDLYSVHGTDSYKVGPGDTVPIRDGLEFNAIVNKVQYG